MLRIAPTRSTLPSGLPVLARPAKVIPRQTGSSARLPEPETIATERLVLRVPQARDLPAYVRAFSRSTDALRPWFPIHMGGETDAQYCARQITRAAEGARTGAAWRRLAFDRRGRVIGAVNLVSIERGLCWQADMNWWVRPDAAGRGYATEIVRAAHPRLFLGRVVG